MTTPLVFKASDIITDALQKLGVYAPGEAVSDADMTRGLTCLNDMLDQWQNEYVFVYSLATLTMNLVNGSASYTIGPPGSYATIVSGRPNKIQAGPGAASVVSGGTTYPVNVVSRLQWSAIQSVDPGPGVPDTLFYDPQYPVGVLNVAPTPNANGMVMTFYSLVPFTLFALQSASAAFFQGTVDALKGNLAIVMKPYFTAAQIDPVVVAMAQSSKEYLRTQGVTSRAMLKRSPSPIGKPSSQAAGA